jgi:MFS family permease
MTANVDRRVLTLALARTADAFGNSFLIVVLPLYIAGPIDLGDPGDLGGVPGPLIGSLTEALAIGIALSTFSFASSLAQPLVGRLSDGSAGDGPSSSPAWRCSRSRTSPTRSSRAIPRYLFCARSPASARRSRSRRR